jgi:hypothetical protein
MKLKKLTKFVDQKNSNLVNLLIPAQTSMTDVQATGEAFRPPKKNIHHFQK